MGVLATFFRHADTLIGYASVRAIESPSALDDRQWLTYWILYALITFFEFSFWKVLQWLPFWSFVKLLFCAWLVLPIFNGAAYMYESLVRNYVRVGVPSVSDADPETQQRKLLRMMSLDARKSVERYIQTYGPDAFDRVVRAAEKEARKQ